MTIIAQAEKNQVVPINWFAVLSGHEIELVFVLLRRDLRINFAAAFAEWIFREPQQAPEEFLGPF